MAQSPDREKDAVLVATPASAGAQKRGVVARLVSLLVLLTGITALFLAVTVPLSVEGQFMLFGMLFVLALMLRRVAGRLVTLMLVWLSVVVSCRYMYWRLTESVGFESNLDMVLGLGLLAAEIYTFVTLLLGYIQTVWPLDREPVELPEDKNLWPTIDVFIPTYNEPLKVVKPTVIGALNMEWPKDKIKVHLLDDGRREEFRQLAEEMGINYITRPDNTDAKAGNINHAMTLTDGELIAIFDCDHVPVKSFLKTTVGWFLRDDKLAVVQTPHHFYSPDPFERNLEIFRKVPNEGELFYGLIQNGNDLWDASFFCGSCAVLRRSALEELGGIATGSVTEDAFTALKLHRKGYRSAYIARKQAAGLATESLAVHVRQRVRWARGMAQILRMDCPLFGPGLSLMQRLCYSNAMLHFFYGLPRIVFLTAPLAFMFFEAHIIQASAMMLAAYVLPFLFINYVVNSRIQGNYRHSFWAEVYETTVSWYAITPTLLALINPRLGEFNVTAKGGLVEKGFFDMKIAIPYLILMLLNLAGLIVGVARLVWWNPAETDTVVLNMMWICYNLIILGAVVAVAREKTQKRSHARVPRDLHAVMRLPQGYSVPCRTLDLSEGGGAFELSDNGALARGAEVEISFLADDHRVALPARVVSSSGKRIRVAFEQLTPEQERFLTQMIFTRDDAWSRWTDCYGEDRPLSSLAEVVSHGLRTLVRFISPVHMARGGGDQLTLNTGHRGLGIGIFFGFILLLVVLFAYAPRANAAPARFVESHPLVELADASRPFRIEAHGAPVEIPFAIRLDEVVTGAELVLAYSHSKNLPLDPLFLEVLVNGEVVASLPLKRITAAGAERTITIDPFLLSDYNRIAFQVVGADGKCRPVDDSVSVVVSKRSQLVLKQQRLKLPNELGRLPLPFFDPRDRAPVEVAFAFGESPSPALLEAAGAIGAWLGAHAAYRGARFEASLGSLPEGNTIVLATPADKPYWLTVPMIEGPSLRLVTHPDDPYAKLLLVLGRNEEELKIAAHTLVAGENPFSGDYAVIENGTLAPRRAPYDAPRWRIANAELGTSGRARLDFMLPPDLFLWRVDGIPMDLTYSYTPRGLDDPSDLQVHFNGSYIASFPLGALRRGTGEGSEPVTHHARLLLPTEKVGAYNSIDLFLNDRLAPGVQRDRCDELLAATTGGSDFRVDGTFTVDLSGLHHYTTLPDLAKFANHGFPFTRYSDLAETAVVLPLHPGAGAVSAYLTLLGHMGAVTGGHATAVSVIAPDEVEAYRDHDLILIGGRGEQPLLSRWRDALPFDPDDPAALIERIEPWEAWIGRQFQTERWLELQRARQVLGDGSRRETALLLAFQSPLQAGRSVVALTGHGGGGYGAVIDALLDDTTLSRLQGDVTVIRGDRIDAFRLGPEYGAGELPATTRLYWYLSQRPWLLFLVILLAIGLLAVRSHEALRRQAELRLRSEGGA